MTSRLTSHHAEQIERYQTLIAAIEFKLSSSKLEPAQRWLLTKDLETTRARLAYERRHTRKEKAA
jgi:hypothetical protein